LPAYSWQGNWFKKDIAPTVTSKRTKYYKAQGTRYKAQARHKAQGASKVQGTRSKKEPGRKFQERTRLQGRKYVLNKKAQATINVLCLEPCLYLDS